MSGELNIREELNGDVSIITLEGEVDIFTSRQLKERLYQIVDTHKNDIKINCEKLDYIDSTGLGILVGTLKRAKQHGKNVYICCLKDNIKKLFLITGLDKVFIIEERKDV